MKNYLKYNILFILLTILSCNQKTTEKKEIHSKKTIEKNSKVESNVDNISDFSELSPIEILDSKNNNVYEAYGIEFQGNCYDCDLAEININKKKFKLVNVCDLNDIYEFEKFTYVLNSDQLIVKTEQNEFVFTKIDNAPIYELKILGNELSMKDKRLSKFYTQKRELKRFKQHDCGDFEG